MTDSASHYRFVLSVFFDDTIVLQIDILFLLFVIFATIYYVGLFRWIQRVHDCLFFKSVARGCATVGSYFGLAHFEGNDSSRGHSTSSSRNAHAANSNNNYQADDNHINHGLATSLGCSACDNASPFKVESIFTDTNTGDAVPGYENPSDAKGALLSLAEDLEFDIANLTQIEADDMLVELRILRSTVGSRVPLFMQQSKLPIDAFDPNACYGENCLIDALM